MNKKRSQCSSAYLPIEDYAIIGELHTVALVGKNGSIDWCCLPRFDAPSVFGALLDAGKGGFFRIAPSNMEEVDCKQMYLPETNVLLTRFLSNEGVGEITDYMPVMEEKEANQQVLIRSLSIVHGSLAFTMTCRPAFNYARDDHRVELMQEGAIFASDKMALSLSSSVPLKQDGRGGVQAHFTLNAGQSLHFVLACTDKHAHKPRTLSDNDFQSVFHDTLHYWQNWLSQCKYQGRWREMVQRSALVLKLLTYAPTGAIVAAATTSLPETLGGARNWDYRYTWLRDASFSLYSLLTLGFTTEAEAFMQWLDNRCHELKEGGSLQPMYTIDGKHDLQEVPLDHLEGYCQSKPVRIGNGAYKQLQLGMYGEMMDAIYIYNHYDAISYDLWKQVLRLLDWLSEHWQEPDESMWEVRGGPKPFVNSRMMSWVAFDRGLRIARHRGWPAPEDKWSKLRAQIYEQVMDKGWSEKCQSFVQYYGSDAVDASALLMMITHFTGSKEPRTLATMKRIRQELASGALVRRYIPQEAANDGLGSVEGTFGACSFWLVENLALAGRLDDARLVLEKLLSYSNHVGLYAEEISPTGDALGNFPQAFTHLALITACVTMDDALKVHKDRPRSSKRAIRNA
ncbi:glycoside hydrolase family 15 protein [Ktedonosporobacter rubrisoli]|uniref:Glycoside hydrolase family 15 protein n=1 Tax=Ktedonosporobacter rubrisoli TaxID=2509675 RepID=A0A4P6JSZ6_KTERU|nr:glycoside hydrolase family 15 protein [Ktedonosporobacter rubrisoli]QBD78689.1 glycoside hydrolase family 15 protein [Ktedonosporobacter rubrisoli]